MTNGAELPQVEPSHYRFARYLTKARWDCIWHQIDDVLAATPESVLEVGVGAGILGIILERFGIHYTSVDIDEALSPTHVAPVTHLPFPDRSFDVVACFQVLEHLPYASFIPALREMSRVSSGRLIISLPDAKRQWPYSVHVPKMGDVRFLMDRPQLRLLEHAFKGEHYWEINKRGYPLARILHDVSEAGLSCVGTYRVFENPYWRFFRLLSRDRTEAQSSAAVATQPSGGGS